MMESANYTSASATSRAGKQETVGLSSTSLEKETYRAPVESRKFYLVAASVSEPGEETHGAGTQTQLLPGSLRECEDCSAKAAKVSKLDSAAAAGMHCCCQGEETRLE